MLTGSLAGARLPSIRLFAACISSLEMFSRLGRSGTNWGTSGLWPTDIPTRIYSVSWAVYTRRGERRKEKKKKKGRKGPDVPRSLTARASSPQDPSRN